MRGPAGEHGVALEEPAAQAQPRVLVLVVFVLADLLPLAPAPGEGSHEEAQLDAIFHDGAQSPDVAGGRDGHAVTIPPCLNLRQRQMRSRLLIGVGQSSVQGMGLLTGTVVILAQDAERAAVGSQGGAGVEPATSRRLDVVESLAPAEDPPGPRHAEAFEP